LNNFIFIDIAKLQKRHSVSSEMKATSIIEFFANYINSGFMYMMIMDVNIFWSIFGLHLKNIINGTYQDFNVLWYDDIGAAIALTMILNVFTPHISNCLLAIFHLFARWRDRCFLFSYLLI